MFLRIRLQRLVEGPPCLCHVSAAVMAEIMLKKVMHMCQVSGCHPKGREARVWKEKKKNLTCLTLSNFARWAKECGEAACPTGLEQTIPVTREAGLSRSSEKSTLPTCPWLKNTNPFSAHGPWCTTHIEAQKPVRLVPHLKKKKTLKKNNNFLEPCLFLQASILLVIFKIG